MWRILSQVLRTGIQTETNLPDNSQIEQLGFELRRTIDSQFKHSLNLRLVDAGSCNGCELEISAFTNPYYDIERFGINFVASPRHADALLVTGPVSRHMEAPLRRSWRAVPTPKFVIAFGDCACSGGEFGISYATCGKVENVIPVDIKILGCPPAPAVLIRALTLALSNRFKNKYS